MPAAEARAHCRRATATADNSTVAAMLKIVAGTAGVGAAAWAAYSAVTGGSVSDQGAKHAGDRYTEAQRHNIDRQLVDQRADVGGRSLGKWIALLPTKMGGGVYALDLNTNRVLASVWYWNYGDFNPIAHHLCAFPSADPYRSFEFVNSTQGGKNSLIYGINTKITDARPRVQHLSRRLRRRADGGDRERVGDDRPGARRARHGQPEGCQVLLRHRRPEGHCGVLRPRDLARHRGAEIRLGREFKGASHLLDPGGQAQDLQDLPG